MGINLNTHIQFNGVNFQSDKSIKSNQNLRTKPDIFVRESKEAFYARRLEEIFPNGELTELYDKLCDELELDYKPKLELVPANQGHAGGGYTFFSNKITLSLEDVVGSDTKIYAIKDGVKSLQTDDKTGVPMMTSKLIAAYLCHTPEAAKNVGVDKLIAEPASNDDIKKLFIQKLYHELVHAKQHMVMRQTEELGVKAILKAWGRSNNKPRVPGAIENMRIEQAYKHSYWADKDVKGKYAYDSEMGEYAQKCINAIENYSAVDTDEYEKNFIEVEAYKDSKNYVVEHYGAWE